MDDILIVDDCPDNLRLLKHLLDGEGVAAQYASSGEEAVQKLLAVPLCGLMITDLNMPEMDGIELAMLAKEISPGITVVMMTGDASPGVTGMAAEAGISKVLSKPFTPEQFLAVIGDRRRFLR